MTPKSYDKSITAIIALASFGVAVALTAYFEKFGFGWSAITGSISTWGQTGDFFGGILNPIFGFLSLLAILITLRQTDISLRQNQIALAQSKEELEESRKEMRRSADALTEQSSHLRLQAFERTFFELLKLHNENIEAISIRTEQLYLIFRRSEQPSPPSVGRDAFVRLYGIFHSRLSDFIEGNPSVSSIDAITEVYRGFYNEHQARFGHYFRTLYNLLKFIDRSDVLNKKFYTDILRAQLSSHELLLIFYNSLGPLGRERLLPLLKKYNLLKHLPTNELVEPDLHMSAFNSIESSNAT